MSEAEIQLRLPARPENVALVRQAVSGIGEALDVSPAVLADMKTAVTEACNNVVLHAYPESMGTMEVEADPEEQHVAITVRDWGDGIKPHAGDPGEEPSPGLGLPLIAALSDRFEIRGGGSNRGIEVRMIFLLTAGASIPESTNGSLAADAPEPPTRDSSRAAGVAIAPGPMMAPVLGRLTAMLAARSDFPLDRLSDAVLVTDAISENVSSYIAGRHAQVTFQDGMRKIDMRFGPLVDGGARELVRSMKLPGLERSLEELADEIMVERGSESDGDDAVGKEFLMVRLSGEDS
jgi:serine/threonine-protein kinase RsbW